MLALFTCLRRLPYLTRDEFREHWSQRYAAFGREHAGVRRYIQYDTIDMPVTEAVPHLDGFNPDAAYDGLGVMWFDDLAAVRAWANGDHVAEMQEDELRFVDRERSVAVLTEEHVMYPVLRPYAVLMIGCLVRPQGATDEEFHQNWFEHIDRAKPVYERGLLTGYFQCHGVSEADRRAAELEGLGYGGNLDPTELNLQWDGFNRGYYDSIAALKYMGADSAWAGPTRTDEERFLDHTRCVGQLSRRRPIKDDMIR